jgi:hypothetical protein
MSDQFDKLRAAYSITVGNDLLPGAGGYGVGAVALVMPDEPSALAWIEENINDLTSLERGPAGIIEVGDPWRFMRRAAREGLAGIESPNKEAPPSGYMFMVRVEEAGTTLPTVLASITEDGWDKCLTRTGVKNLDHAEVFHWQRYDILDRVTGQWGKNCPFRNWEQGDKLYELRSDSLVVLIANVPLLGDWNSPKGAFAFFTSKEEATHYHHHHLGDGRNRMLLVSPGAPEDAHEAMASLQPRPLNDLNSRLEELSTISPIAAWCVNPDGHRENSAYGRIFGSNFSDDDLHRQAPSMSAVSGIWNVQPNNYFKLIEPLAPWSTNDTIRWSGGQSLQLIPLDRTFILQQAIDGLIISDEPTDSDTEEMVTQFLESIGLEESWDHLFKTVDRVSERLEQFHIVCWDAVTGDGADHPWRFPSFLEALKHLAAYEREHDRHHRIEGAVSCGNIGFSGSGDAHFEDLRSSRFCLGLKRLALRTFQKSYQPRDATDLVALCNGTLSTLHVNFAGYAKDLLWASPSEQEEGLLDDLGIDEGEWRQWSDSSSATIDPTGRKLIIDQIGEANWELLLPQVQHFLATALLHLNQQGSAPQMDYAPISLEIVKALEVELSDIFRSFRDTIPARGMVYNEDDHAECSLMFFLEGKKPPTLGPASHLFRESGTDASELRKAFHQFLTGLPNGEFLTSNKFVKRGLQRVIHKYRNGGVHDSPISEQVCRECVKILIGSPYQLGYIPQVVQWKG